MSVEMRSVEGLTFGCGCLSCGVASLAAMKFEREFEYNTPISFEFIKRIIQRDIYLKNNWGETLQILNGPSGEVYLRMILARDEALRALFTKFKNDALNK